MHRSVLTQGGATLQGIPAAADAAHSGAAPVFAQYASTGHIKPGSEQKAPRFTLTAGAQTSCVAPNVAGLQMSSPEQS
jgi:hypothetical protein